MVNYPDCGVESQTWKSFGGIMDDSDGSCKSEMENVFRIFRDEDSSGLSKRVKCIFQVIRSNAAQRRGELDRLIFHSGGSILEEPSTTSDYAVTILDEKYFYDNPNEDSILPLDTFSSLYVHHAIRAKQNKAPIPSLEKYRLTASKFEAYDPNKVLFQEKKWSELLPQKDQSETIVTAQQVVSYLKKVVDGKSNAAVLVEQNDVDQPEMPSIFESSCPNIETVHQPPPHQEIVPSDPEFPPSPAPSIDVQASHRRRMVVVSSSTTSANESSIAEGGSSDSDDGLEQPRVKKRKHDAHIRRSQEDKGKQSPKPHSNAGRVRPPIFVNLVPRAVAGPGSSGHRALIKRTESSNANQVADTGNGDSCEDVSFNEDDSSDVASVRTTNESITYGQNKRRPFSVEEGQRLLNLICDNNAFMYIKGNRLWEQVESSKKFPGRTFQSLKEHFKKQVLPNVLKAKKYKISPEHLKRLQKAQERSEYTKHSNVCPDYTF